MIQVSWGHVRAVIMSNKCFVILPDDDETPDKPADLKTNRVQADKLINELEPRLMKWRPHRREKEGVQGAASGCDDYGESNPFEGYAYETLVCVV
jgi:hypothetical protein